MSQRQKFLGLVGLVVLVVVAIALVNVAQTNAQGPGNGPCTEDDEFSMGQGMMGGRGNHGMMDDCDNQGMMQNGMMNGMMQDGMMNGMMGQGMMQNGMGHHGMMGDFDGSFTSPMWEGMMREHSMGNGPTGDHNNHDHQGPQSNQGNQGMGNMMQAWTPPADLIPAETPFDLDTAAIIATAYITEQSDDNLVLGEVMAFDNHFYATALEADTERGAFEFLIDPATGIVYTEPGPNMMWNLRYGQHTGMGVGMMGGFNSSADGVEMDVTDTEAVELAQAFLNEFDEDFVAASDDVEAFYGYYTLHITQNGEIVGMLSVNGYTGQVWMHHWHGEFVEMMPHR